MTLEQLVGQHLMIGISGSQVTPEVVELFQDTHAGGLIVFRPNFKSASTFKKMISDLESNLDRKLLVAVDHEGGRVIHLCEGITVFPDNLALGRTQNEEYAKQQGEIEACELRRLGIDLNLAPTLDVLTDSFSPNIGIRSYGKDPELVSRLGYARIKAMQEGGLSACAKHFPGQGHSSMDAHLGLPLLGTTWDEMRQIHIKPFIAAITAGVDTIMSSHPVYPNLDPTNVPATFSKRIIHDYLRNELAYKGVILSDDLEMGALRGICSIGESAVRAVEAGHDIVLICHDAHAVKSSYHALLEAYRNKRLKFKDLENCISRINHLKDKRKKRFLEGEVMPEPEGERVATLIARDSIRTKHTITDPVSVIFPRLSSLADKIMIEKEMMDEKAYVETLFDGNLVESFIVRIDPTDQEIEQALTLANRNCPVLFFCYDAHLYPQTRKLLEKLQNSSKKIAVITLRDPYDSEFVRKDVLCINAFGFRDRQIKSVLASIKNNR